MILTVTLNASIDKLYVVDRLEPYKVMRVREVNNTAGGKGLNVSRVAALLGEPVVAMGFVGGYSGGLFKSLIQEPGITPQFTEVAGETRCCINVRDLNANKSTEFLEPGAPVTPEDLGRFLADYRNALPAADVVTVSGSMPAGAPADFYATIVADAKAAGKGVILDTSGPPLKAALAGKPDLIKPNADEIRQLADVDAGSLEALVDAAQRVRAQGAAAVVVSLGKGGALAVSGEGVFRGMTPDIPVVNTVGCGDSMVAGFAVEMARKQPLQEALRRALAVSTANALTKETGSFIKSDLERLMGQVSVTPL